MQLLVCVLNETEKLEDLMTSMSELGLSGATVLESQGMIGSHVSDEWPALSGVRHLVTADRKFNYTMFSVVEDDRVAHHTLEAIRRHLLPGTHEGTRGIAFTVPVSRFVNFHADSDDAPPAPEAVKSEGEVTFAILEALKQTPAERPGLISNLLGGLKSLALRFSLDSQEGVKDRRQVVRLQCHFETTCQVGGRAVPVTVTDIGPTGVRAEMAATLHKEGVVLLNPPPTEAGDFGPIECRVLWFKKQHENVCSAGLAYQGSPEALGRSWVASLLSGLGYCQDHLTQRREFLRVASRLPVEIRTLDEELFPGKVLNLGVGGTLISCDREWPGETLVEVVIGPYKDRPPLDLPATVVSHRPDSGSDRTFCSLRFHKLDARQVADLGEYVLALLQERHDEG